MRMVTDGKRDLALKRKDQRDTYITYGEVVTIVSSKITGISMKKKPQINTDERRFAATHPSLSTCICG